MIVGFFDAIFKRRPKPAGEFQGNYRLLTVVQPDFYRTGGDIYESELIRASIDAIARNVSKLSVTVAGSAKPSLQVKLKHGPNEIQTWGQFLYRLATILYVHNTAFIVPAFDQYGDVSGIYCVLPDQCTVVQYNNKPYLKYQFSWGDTAAMELEACGIMTRHQYRSDLFGESNRVLTPTMDLIAIQNQGIQEGVKSAATYRFMAQAGNFTKTEDLAKERKRFSEENFTRESQAGGLLLFPNTYTNIQQIETTPFVADAKQMDLVAKEIYDYFGVNEDVLQNKAYGDSWAAFYEGCIEPFAIQLADVLTKMLFTLRERSSGSGVYVSANRLQYMTNADKLSVSAQMLDRGILTINEVREIWQLPPVEGGDERIIRGEYYNADEKVEGDDTNEPQNTD